jgi:hypothetical protein
MRKSTFSLFFLGLNIGAIISLLPYPDNGLLVLHSVAGGLCAVAYYLNRKLEHEEDKKDITRKLRP